MIRQMNEGEEPSLACQNGHRGKYLDRKTLENRDEGWVARRHPCFASSAKLKQWRSRNPIPPSGLEEHKRPQLIQCILCSSAF